MSKTLFQMKKEISNLAQAKISNYLEDNYTFTYYLASYAIDTEKVISKFAVDVSKAFGEAQIFQNSFTTEFCFNNAIKMISRDDMPDRENFIKFLNKCGKVADIIQSFNSNEAKDHCLSLINLETSYAVETLQECKDVFDDIQPTGTALEIL